VLRRLFDLIITGVGRQKAIWSKRTVPAFHVVVTTALRSNCWLVHHRQPLRGSLVIAVVWFRCRRHTGPSILGSEKEKSRVSRLKPPLCYNANGVELRKLFVFLWEFEWSVYFSRDSWNIDTVDAKVSGSGRRLMPFLSGFQDKKKKKTLWDSWWLMREGSVSQVLLFVFSLTSWFEVWLSCTSLLFKLHWT
jgi:hypothetical protein